MANVDSALLEEEGTLSCSNAFGFSSPNLLDDFCCGDGLAGVALGVVGAMDEETADRCGQGFAAYGTGLLEVGVGEGLKAADRVVDSLSKFRE